jgi:hypothetical protein
VGGDADACGPAAEVTGADERITVAGDVLLR